MQVAETAYLKQNPDATIVRAHQGDTIIEKPVKEIPQKRISADRPYEDVMTPEELKERDRQRVQCGLNHSDLHIPTNGLGWTGTMCPRCGFSFFGDWEDWWVKSSGHITSGDQPDRP